MAVNTEIRRIVDFAAQMGRSTLAAAAPHDFEYYLVALELTDGSGNTIDFFSFPIMPTRIRKQESKRTQIVQSSTGVTALSSTGFAPQTISLEGDFGKYMKLVINSKQAVGDAVAYSIQSGKYDLYQLKAKTLSANFKVLEAGIKTGFGALNILRAIISKSNGVDDKGKPFRLYFYNMALGESYLVSVPNSGLSVQQNVGRNGIWTYNLDLTILAPLELIIARDGIKTSLVKILSGEAIQKTVSGVASKVLELLL